MTPSDMQRVAADMRRIAAECGVEIHKYTTTPGAIYVTLHPTLPAKVALFMKRMDAAMPSSVHTIVTSEFGTFASCRTTRSPTAAPFLTLDERRLREAQAGTRVCILTATSA